MRALDNEILKYGRASQINLRENVMAMSSQNTFGDYAQDRLFAAEGEFEVMQPKARELYADLKAEIASYSV